MLEPEQPSSISDQTSTPPLLVKIDGKLEYEINKIVDSKFDKQFRCPLRYKVKWLGYKDDTNAFTWQAANELNSAQEAIADFHAKYLDKPGPLAR
jgi:hypothetical protein